MTKRHSFEYVKRNIEQKGFILISKTYVDAKSKLEVICKCGEPWSAAYNNIVYSDQSCFKCAQKKKSAQLSFTQDYVKGYLKDINIELLDTYKNTASTMALKCLKCQRIWRAAFGDLKRNHGCPACFNARRGDNLRHSESYVAAYINDKGGTLKSCYKSLDSKIQILCHKCNNTWESSFCLVRRGSGCQFCSGVILDADGIKQHAAAIGCVVKSKKRVFKNEDYVDVVCDECSYKWTTTVRDIKYRYTGCSRCNSSIKQRMLEIIIKDIFQNHEVMINYRKLSFMKNNSTNRSFEIDIWVPDKKIAIEYDGRQHFHDVRFAKTMQSKHALAQVKKRDKQKDQLAQQAIRDGHLNAFIRFNYREPINKEYVYNKILKYHG